jgi:hypothetical protein
MEFFMTYEDVIETLALRAANRFIHRMPAPWLMNDEDVIFTKAFGHDVDAVHFGVTSLFQDAVRYLGSNK